MEKIKAIFFDYDDTLQDRTAAYRIFCMRFLKKYFPEKTEEEREIMADQMDEHIDGGYMARELYFPILFDLWHWENHPPLESLCREFNLIYGEKTVLFPETIPVIEELKKRGYILGIITNGVSVLQNMKLDTSGIRPYFSSITVSGDCEFAKPDVRIFELGAEKAGLKTSECAFVGDHPVNDIKGAMDSGMMPIRMNFGSFKDQGMFEGVKVIENLNELLEIFQKPAV